MQFKVRDWMMDLVVYVDPESSVSDALSLMRRRYISSLVINKSEENPNYGIITSTDICDKIVAAERNPSETLVKEIMNFPVLTVPRDYSLKQCADLMSQNHIHHLPVADEDGKLVGMISATDFLVAAEAMGRKPGERIGD